MQNKIDTLNREPFVEQVFNLIETISANKGNTAFAIDGEWGCGKSFALDMIEEKLFNTQKEDSDENKYFVIKYNCWQYDFYEEPLIAFVSAIINLIKESNGLFAEKKTQNKILNGLKKIGVGLLNIGNVLLKNKVGVDIKSMIDPLTTATKDAKASTAENNDTISYDNFYTFRNKLNELRDILSEISKTQTIIIVVDELDRCLPDYAIKVLERLHHITEMLPNTITVIATNKSKLANTVKSIYGFADKDINLYLKKFINFEIPLNNGTNDENVIQKYADYINQFKNTPISCNLTDFISTLFLDIPSREQEQLFEQAKLVHNLINNPSMDYTVLSAELMLVVLDRYYKIPNILQGVRTRFLDHPFDTAISYSNLNGFIDKMGKTINTVRYNRYEFSSVSQKYFVTPQTDIYGIMLWYLNALSINTSFPNILHIQNETMNKHYQNNLSYLRNFIEILKVIK